MTNLARSTYDMAAWFAPVPKLDNVSLIVHLWNRFNAMYPGKWTKEFTEEKSITGWLEGWAEAFVEDGLTPNDVATGLRACRRVYDWPPSLSEFMKLCRPFLIPENAFHDAVRGLAARKRGETGHWAHPAIYWATVRIGRHDMENCGYAVLRTRWESALSDELSRGAWEPVPAPAVALPAPDKTAVTTEQAERALRKLTSAAGAVIGDQGRDPKRGAKRILAEMGRKGGRRYSPTVVAMARRAIEQSNPGA